MMLLAFALAAGWLALDLSGSRDRIIEERSRLAAQKSQFMSQWFGTTILTTDYVLRDVLGRISTDDLVYPDPDPDHFQRMRAMLAEKTASLPAILDIAVYNKDCVFTATGSRPVDGFRSRQVFCATPDAKVSSDSYVQYMPTEKSASKRPVILISRNLVTQEGRLVGGALAALDLDQAQEWIADFQVDPHDVLAMVDIQGILLARNPPIPDAIGTITPPPPGQPAFGSARASATFVAVSPLDGRERIFGVSKIEQIPVAIIVGFDKASALAE
ncbi:hypothetical protein [Paramagnetospirillum marisnigri]|uniref:hypothetical protein n=1 Tax=Paramagnetospirillum marisnigri TaxID=1285242 RepID=UPI001FE1F7C4|nr:hypothetical protein [Paramagnetospirillum marisnigri]